MTRWGRDPDEIRLDIAYAIGNDEDVLAHLTAGASARWGTPQEREDGEADAWDPVPAELREGEHSDVSGHAARNIALLREAARDGAISQESARESIQPIREDDDT